MKTFKDIIPEDPFLSRGFTAGVVHLICDTPTVVELFGFGTVPTIYIAYDRYMKNVEDHKQPKETPVVNDSVFSDQSIQAIFDALALYLKQHDPAAENTPVGISLTSAAIYVKYSLSDPNRHSSFNSAVSEINTFLKNNGFNAKIL